MKNSKPIIGIVAKNTTIEDTNMDWLRHIHCSHLRYALIDSGAIVIGILPPNHTKSFAQDDSGDIKNNMTKQEKEDIIRQVNLCDGIVLQGGLFSDFYEEFVAKYCYDNNIPLLGICAGFNNIVRGLGGTTHDKIDYNVHNREDLQYAHEITINKNTLLYSILKEQTIKVNSLHTWAAKTLKGNIVASAFAPDGNIEAIEDKSKTFLLGLKFHPELLYETDVKLRNIFKTFVNACKKNKKGD